MMPKGWLQLTKTGGRPENERKDGQRSERRGSANIYVVGRPRSRFSMVGRDQIVGVSLSAAFDGALRQLTEAIRNRARLMCVPRRKQSCSAQKKRRQGEDGQRWRRCQDCGRPKWRLRAGCSESGVGRFR